MVSTPATSHCTHSQPPISDCAAAIRVRDLTIAYRAQSPVLQNVSLSVAAGEIVALVGASGCGKSTLLRAIAGLLQPQQGQVRFEPELPQRSGALAYVFQSATLLPWRTVDENIGLPLELGRGGNLRPAWLARDAQTDQSSLLNCREQIAAARRAVGLADDSAGKFPRQLSGGMQMRTSIARGLVTDPSVLLLDEPFAALDEILRTKLNELVLELWHSRPRTIVFVTHNVAEAIYLSHRVVVMGMGRIEQTIATELPWPRQAAARSSLEFAKLYGRISAALAEASS